MEEKTRQIVPVCNCVVGSFSHCLVELCNIHVPYLMEDPVRFWRETGVIRMVSPAEGFETGEPECPRECRCRPLHPSNCTLPGRGPKYGPVSRQHTVLFPESPCRCAMVHYCLYSWRWEFLLLSLGGGLTFSPEKGVQDSQARSISVQTSYWRLVLSWCPQTSFSG